MNLPASASSPSSKSAALWDSLFRGLEDRSGTRYKPRGVARRLQEETGPEIVLSGPAGTGKSRACLEKIHACALAYPRMRALIVRKTRVSLSETGLVTYETHVLGPDNPIAQGPSRPHRHAYLYPNGSEVITGGMDRATRMMSTEYDLIYVQEATELALNDWESLTTRLRNGQMPFQQLIGDCNPDAPTHWLKRRADEGRTLMLDSSHEDNPLLYDGVRDTWTPAGLAYIAKLDDLTGVRKERLRYGRWVGAEGGVYEFTRAVHLVDRFSVPAMWSRFRAIDFGYTNPFVCQWWAIDPDGRLYLYREIYMTQRTVAAHAAQIKTLSEGERIAFTVADHDAEDRATLAEHGIATLPANKAVSPGIQAVQERLKRASDGRPRIFVMRDSLVEADPLLVERNMPYRTEQEFDSYVWNATKDEPVKRDDHGMDALRYAVMAARGAGVTRSLGVVAQGSARGWSRPV